MDDRPLAHLEHVDPATVWKSEPGDFVPWLAAEENIRRLGNALKLDLEPVAREAPVGRFRADLVCRDRDTGAAVVIEAQLGPSDHGHLGQLLTYAMGLPAGTVVWLATRFHVEHRVVVDGLNRLGYGDIRCFAVAMDLWKIGASLTAPQFTVFAAPQDWPGPVAAPPGHRTAAADPEVAPADPANRLPFDENPIKTRRLSRGMSVRQLANAAGISRAYLSAIENGRRWGSPEKRAAIARALDLPPHALARPQTACAMQPETGDRRRTAE